MVLKDYQQTQDCLGISLTF